MCVSLPARVLTLAGNTAFVAVGQNELEVGRVLLPESRPGDWVLVNAGQMISTVAPEEVEALRELLAEMESLEYLTPAAPLAAEALPKSYVVLTRSHPNCSAPTRFFQGWATPN